MEAIRFNQASIASLLAHPFKLGTRSHLILKM